VAPASQVERAPTVKETAMTHCSSSLAIALIIFAGCSDSDTEPELELEPELQLMMDEVDVECGTIKFRNVENDRCPDTAAALRCFEGSRGQHPHIKQAFDGIEGGVINDHFFIEAGNVIAVHDATGDAYGPGSITRRQCRSLELLVIRERCQMLICSE
jgi:hypothetical protein